LIGVCLFLRNQELEKSRQVFGRKKFHFFIKERMAKNMSFSFLNYFFLAQPEKFLKIDKISFLVNYVIFSL